MKYSASSFLLFIAVAANSQIANKQYGQNYFHNSACSENEIVALEKSISIHTKVIYNAVPDGYHITYSKSFIGKTVDDVEQQMNTAVNNLIKEVQNLNIAKKDVVVDIVSLDPIFNIQLNESSENLPIGYKVSENITFNIKSISAIGALSKKCLDYGIFDLINAQAYLINSKPIYDSLSNKAVELLDMKKKLSSEIGWAFSGGTPTFNKFKDVIYPGSNYLKAYARSATLYQHQLSQNTTVNLNRSLEVDNYVSMDLKDADFIFNADKTTPVIQFYYLLDYVYTKKDTEAEIKEKMKKEESKKVEQIYYIIDKTGNLKKIEM